MHKIYPRNIIKRINIQYEQTRQGEKEELMHHFENRKMGILERVQRNRGRTKATMTRTEKRKWSRFGREDKKSGKPCQQRVQSDGGCGATHVTQKKIKTCEEVAATLHVVGSYPFGLRCVGPLHVGPTDTVTQRNFSKMQPINISFKV